MKLFFSILLHYLAVAFCVTGLIKVELSYGYTIFIVFLIVGNLCFGVAETSLLINKIRSFNES